MNRLSMFKKCQTDDLENSRWLEDRVVNIPSSVPEGMLKIIIFHEYFRVNWSQ